MRLVSGSSSQYSSRSFDETSALFPIETNADRPSPRPSAASRSASPSAPLCDETATFPGGSALGPNVAFSRPQTRRCRGNWARRASRRAHGSLRATRPVAFALGPHLREAGGDHAERLRAGAECVLGRLEHVLTGDADRRRGRSSRPISAIDWYARTPATGSPLRLTGYAMPTKPASSTFRYSSPPIEPRRDEAPTTATVRG